MAPSAGGHDQRTDTFLGAVLVGAALLIGVLLLVKGYSACLLYTSDAADE